MQDFFQKLATLVAVLPLFYGACAVVQATVLKPKARYVVVGALIFLAFLVGLTGLLFIAVPTPEIYNPRSGALLLIFAAITILPLLKPVRRLLALVTPISPNSTVDIAGIIAAGWFILSSAAVLFTIDLAAIAGQVNITVADAIINVLAYPALALSLVGIWITRLPREAIKRLGLERLSPRQLFVSFALVVPMMIIGLGVDWVGQRLQPDLYAQLEAVLNAMSSNITNPAVALIIGVSAGVGEEILFRGALQPRLGIGLTALIFAVAHMQYGASYAIIGVLLIGILLGYQRRYMNTTASIVTHATYDVIVFLLAYLSRGGV